MSIGKWLFTRLLLLQAHFSASYLVPLDREAQGEFRRPFAVALALERWRQWAIGPGHGSFRLSTLRILPRCLCGDALFRCCAGGDGVWVPFGWWKVLAGGGAILSLVQAFGPEFDRLTNQPAGENREGFLGLYAYRNLRSSRNVDFVETGTGDEEIIDGYATYAADTRRDVLLLSNEYGFIENATDRGLLAHHTAFSPVLPRRTTASWRAIGDTLYILAVLFGVLVLPKVTLYGVWNGKDGTHWQHGQLIVNCRSPKIEPLIERQQAVIDAYEAN